MADKRLSNRAMTFQWRSKTHPLPPPHSLPRFPFSFKTSGLKLPSTNERRIKRSFFSPPPLLFAYQKIPQHGKPFVAGFNLPPFLPLHWSLWFFLVQGVKARVEAEQESIDSPSANHLLVSSVVKQVESSVGRNRRVGREAGNHLGQFQPKSRDGRPWHLILHQYETVKLKGDQCGLTTVIIVPFECEQSVQTDYEAFSRILYLW